MPYCIAVQLKKNMSEGKNKSGKPQPKLLVFIKSYPMLFGVFIGLLIFGSIVIIETWFPWIAQAWEKHYRFVQSLCFTAGLFGTLVIQFWNRRHRGAFWAVMCIFFLLHLLGVAYYSTHIQPLILRQWIILLIAECGVVIFSLDPLMKLFGQLVKYAGKPGHSMGK
jgi:hypothetical protein